MACDQLLKLLVERSIPLGAEIALVPGLVTLTHVRNPGVAFSLLRDVPLLVPMAIALTLLSLVFSSDAAWTRRPPAHPGLAVLTGGAVGNLVDRLRIGAVIVNINPTYTARELLGVAKDSGMRCLIVLDALAPGRIDMGLGRAPGSDGRTAFALNPAANERPEHFPADVRDLIAWVHGEPLVDRHPFAAVKAFPQGDTAPEIWILGSSDYGAQVAALFGLPVNLVVTVVVSLFTPAPTRERLFDAGFGNGVKVTASASAMAQSSSCR